MSSLSVNFYFFFDKTCQLIWNRNKRVKKNPRKNETGLWVEGSFLPMSFTLMGSYLCLNVYNLMKIFSVNYCKQVLNQFTATLLKQIVSFLCFSFFKKNVFSYQPKNCLFGLRLDHCGKNKCQCYPKFSCFYDTPLPLKVNPHIISFKVKLILPFFIWNFVQSLWFSASYRKIQVCIYVSLVKTQHEHHSSTFPHDLANTKIYYVF